MIAPFELDCAHYEIKSASIGCGHGAAVFSCTLSPVGNEVLEGLESVARSGETLRLVFPKRPLILERIDVRRVRPGGVRISGRVVDHG